MEELQVINQKNSDLYDQYLCEFQEDIKRIVGKFKKSFHALTDEEVYSECNMHLLKSKDKILKTFSEGQEFNQAEFKKIAYHFAKNEVVWSHYRFQNKSYNRRKLDGIIETDDGPKSLFEATIETAGIENEDLDNDFIYFTANSKKFFHVLNTYSYLLTEQEGLIISYIRKGFNQDQIAEKLEVTHQAISFSFKNIQAKLRSYFNFDEVMNGGSVESIQKGVKALNNFFNNSNKELLITAEDKKKIKKYILSNPKRYTAEQINKKLFNLKYSTKKVWGAIKSLKLTKQTVSRNRPFTDEERSLMLKYFKEGKTIDEVSKLVGVKFTSARRIREELVRKGLLEKLNKINKQIK
jgi:transposase